MVERLWAGWRIPYIEQDDAHRTASRMPGLSLFEGIEQSGLPDDETYVLWRGPRCFALLNAFPYGSGHLMVLPKRAVADLEALEADEHDELWAAVRDAVVAVKAAYRPQGVNIGINLGTAAGAGVPGHLHVHVLPRWAGDTNFMTSVAEVRVLPEPLSDTWRKLRAAWPGPAGGR
jgi:diadenosine tetraphosphate (Ap4A) HIT family hydrolase